MLRVVFRNPAEVFQPVGHQAKTAPSEPELEKLVLKLVQENPAGRRASRASISTTDGRSLFRANGRRGALARSNSLREPSPAPQPARTALQFTILPPTHVVSTR